MKLGCWLVKSNELKTQGINHLTFNGAGVDDFEKYIPKHICTKINLFTLRPLPKKVFTTTHVQ